MVSSLVDSRQLQFTAYFRLAWSDMTWRDVTWRDVTWRDTEASPWTEGGSSGGAPLTVLMACRKGILVGRNALSCLLSRFGDARAVFCLRHYRSWQQCGLLQVLLFGRSLLPPSSGFSGGIGLQNVGTGVPHTHTWCQVPQNLKLYWSSNCRCLWYGRSMRTLILLGVSLLEQECKNFIL